MVSAGNGAFSNDAEHIQQIVCQTVNARRTSTSKHKYTVGLIPPFTSVSHTGGGVGFIRLLASQPVSLAPGLSSLRQESPRLAVPPTMHLRPPPHPCQRPAFNWVLTSLYFTVSIISLSLVPSLCNLFLEPFPSRPFTAATTNTFFFLGILKSKHFLHIKMWNSFWHWAENRVAAAVCPYLFFSVFSSSSLSLYSVHGSTLLPHFPKSPRHYPVR